MMSYKIFAVALVAFIALDGSEAHLTQICTATSASTPGRIDFYLGSYHAKIRRPRGTVHLVNTGGTKVTGNFNEAFHVNPRDYKIGSPADTAKKLKKVVGNKMPKNSVVTCYTHHGIPGSKAPPKGGGVWIIPAATSLPRHKWACANTGAYSTTQSWARIKVLKATSGDWKLTTKGTDMNFNPGRGLCAMSYRNPKWIQGMAVADGSPPCKGTPPVPSSIDKNSVKNCPKFSGAVCSTAKCNTKLLKSPKMHGQIACIKGKWQVSAPGKVAKCTGKPVRVIAKCENVATKGLQTITTSVNAQQKVLNAFSDGCSCANKGQAAVRTARTNHHNSVVRHKAAVRAHSAAASASVAIPSQILHKIKPGKCGFAFSSSAYKNAHNRHRNALNHRNTRHRQMTGYKTKYDNAVRAAAKAMRKCQCIARHKYRVAWQAAIAHNKQNKYAWAKSQHLLCVHRGSIKLHSNGNTLGKCSHAKCPEVKKKKLCAAVEKLKEPDCRKGVHWMEEEEAAALAETELLQSEQSDTVKRAPEGYHTMSNGEIMADSDMH